MPSEDQVSEYIVSFEHPQDVSINFEFFFPRDSLPHSISRPDAGRTILSVVSPGGAD